MKIPNWLKIVWWFLLVGFFIYLFVQRYEFIMSGSVTAADIVILLILIALITIPLFQEVDFFGVRLKREIDNVKNEFEKQIISLKSEIKQNQTVNITYPPPSPEDKLPGIIQNAETTLKEELRKLAVGSRPAPEATIPDNISYLFAARYNIENELNRLTDLYWMVEDKTFYPKTVTQKLEFLVKMKVISPNLASILKEMYAQSSAAIHGEQISEQATQWIRQHVASTVQVLKGIAPQPAEATKVQRDV